MGAGSGVDAGMAPSQYRLVTHDVVGEVRITTSPDVTDGAMGKTGIHFIRSSQAFPDAGAAAGATNHAPGPAVTQDFGQQCAVQVVASFGESMGCDPATGQADATSTAGLAAIGLAAGNVQTILPNPNSG